MPKYTVVHSSQRTLKHRPVGWWLPLCWGHPFNGYDHKPSAFLGQNDSFIVPLSSQTLGMESPGEKMWSSLILSHLSPRQEGRWRRWIHVASRLLSSLLTFLVLEELSAARTLCMQAWGCLMTNVGSSIAELMAAFPGWLGWCSIGTPHSCPLFMCISLVGHKNLPGGDLWLSCVFPNGTCVILRGLCVWAESTMVPLAPQGSVCILMMCDQVRVCGGQHIPILEHSILGAKTPLFIIIPLFLMLLGFLCNSWLVIWRNFGRARRRFMLAYDGSNSSSILALF